KEQEVVGVTIGKKQDRPQHDGPGEEDPGGGLEAHPIESHSNAERRTDHAEQQYGRGRGGVAAQLVGRKKDSRRRQSAAHRHQQKGSKQLRTRGRRHQAEQSKESKQPAGRAQGFDGLHDAEIGGAVSLPEQVMRLFRDQAIGEPRAHVLRQSFPDGTICHARWNLPGLEGNGSIERSIARWSTWYASCFLAYPRERASRRSESLLMTSEEPAEAETRS